MRIFIEADSVAMDKMSGIGHTTLEILNSLDRKANELKLDIVAIVPFGKRKIIKTRYNWKNIRIKQLPPGYKYVNYALTRTSLPIPVDLYFGMGIYVFPNYKTWYTPFSKSYTFIDDIAFKLFPQTTQPQNFKYLTVNFDRWLKRATQFVSISNQSKNEVQKAFPITEGKIKTIYLGVDPDEYHPKSQSESDSVVEKYGLNRNYILSVGNLEPRKNIMNLLEGYRLFSDNHRVAPQLVLVGGEGWKDEETLIKIQSMLEAGYDIYRPSKYVVDADLPALYSGAKALVHLAIHEGFGLPPLQSQACGVPVLVSDIPVFHETLNPKYSVYVKSSDVKKITIGLESVLKLNHPYKSVAKKELTWDNTTENLLKYTGIM